MFVNFKRFFRIKNKLSSFLFLLLLFCCCLIIIFIMKLNGGVKMFIYLAKFDWIGEIAWLNGRKAGIIFKNGFLEITCKNIIGTTSEIVILN